jgi:hypothetical protein
MLGTNDRHDEPSTTLTHSCVWVNVCMHVNRQHNNEPQNMFSMIFECNYTHSNIKLMYVDAYIMSSTEIQRARV